MLIYETTLNCVCDDNFLRRRTNYVGHGMTPNRPHSRILATFGNSARHDSPSQFWEKNAEAWIIEFSNLFDKLTFFFGVQAGILL